MGNKNTRADIFKISVFLIFIGPIICSAQPKADRRVAKKIAQEKGVLKPSEVWQWQTSPKDVPNDWSKVDNKYFSVSYPKCFTIEGEGGEDDPKIAPSILFRRSKKCSDFKNGYGDSNSMSIGYFPTGGITTVEGAFSAEYPLVRQKIKINGIDAISLAGLMDYYDESQGRYDSQLRWQLFLICNKKTYRIVTTVPPGSPTMSLVNNNNYAWPDDFKGIISTFRCK